MSAHSPEPNSPSPWPKGQAGPASAAGRGAVLDPESLELALSTLQQRIDQLHKSLAQQNKLATLGMVTAVIAHEFNNILTPMISYTKFALTDKADEALRNKALNKALGGAERLANISKSLLGFARGDESTSVNVLAAVKETLACLARDPAKDGITLTLDVAEDLNVAMNAGYFQQVLMNLIVNARSAMLAQSNAQGGKGAVGGPKRLTVRAAQIKRGKIVEVSVADTGPGIPAEVLPRIFEPFFTTKRNGTGEDSGIQESMPRGGTGLGLAICQELVSMAGGTIRVSTKPGEGSVFTLELPAG